MLKGFRNFLMRGDVITVAVGLVVALAFSNLVKALLLPGLQELAEGKAPTHLVICEKDRVLPHPRFTRHFTTRLPQTTQITHFDGVGHIPMFEAPRRVADLIVDFTDRYATPPPHRAIG